ncbi:hypothetical protein SUGI_0973950 [Cryptomeria japonica]|nr:hypothetical protein SUGI_0973950 [Cryptomeria japonica]
MVNDNVGIICNAHVVRVDLSDSGALDEDYLKLAQLVAQVVDFPKSGKTPVMQQYLKPMQYPDFMDKEDSVSYWSKNILGTLYQKVLDIFGEEFYEQNSCIDLPNSSETLPYDNDLEVTRFEEYVEEAWQYKCSYDRLQALLGQTNVRKEGEIVTGNITSLSKYKAGDQTKSRRYCRMHTKLCEKSFN